eukprot:1155386-Pelagomonas_calceolata.AAC.8
MRRGQCASPCLLVQIAVRNFRSLHLLAEVAGEERAVAETPHPLARNAAGNSKAFAHLLRLQTRKVRGSC